MKNLKAAFGFRLKEIRKSKNYTQETLAEMIDLSPRQLIRIENGENFPSTETVERICSVLNIRLEVLFDFRGNEEIMHFTTGTYSKPSIKVIKDQDSVTIKSLANSHDADELVKNTYKFTEYESKIFDLCKKKNKPITVELFENKQRVSVKTYYPNNSIEIVLSSEDIIKNELNNYILEKLKKLSLDINKLHYIKLAIDSLENKKSLEQLKVIIKGIELIL